MLLVKALKSFSLSCKGAYGLKVIHDIIFYQELAIYDQSCGLVVEDTCQQFLGLAPTFPQTC